MTNQPHLKLYGEWQPCESVDKVATMNHLRYLSKELEQHIKFENTTIEERVAQMIAQTLDMLKSVKFESELRFEASCEETTVKINIFGNPTPNDVNQLSWLGVISDEQAYNWFKSKG